MPTKRNANRKKIPYATDAMESAASRGVGSAATDNPDSFRTSFNLPTYSLALALAPAPAPAPALALGQVGVQLDTPPLPRPSGHIQGLHLLAGHKRVPPPPSERSTGSRHTSKSLTHTPLNSLGQVGVQLDTPTLSHPSGHTPSLHTPMSRSRESQEGCSPTTLFPSFYRQDSDSVGWTHTLGSHFSAQILG